MPSRLELIKEIETVPEPLLDEVMDFISLLFLVTRHLPQP
jgi:hypothetical protein